MGQQQLLLLVLGIVIVGLAVVAGINAFQENNVKSQKDAMVNEGMRIATDIQSYVLKPTAMGGGGGDFPADLGPAIEGVDDGVSDYETPWGTITYAYTDGAANATLTLKPTSSTDEATINIPGDGTSPSLDGGWVAPTTT